MKTGLILLGLIFLIPIFINIYEIFYSSEMFSRIEKESTKVKVLALFPPLLVSIFIDFMIISAVFLFGGIFFTKAEFRDIAKVDTVENELYSLELAQGGNIEGGYRGGLLTVSTGNINGEVVPYYYYYIKENNEYVLKGVDYRKASIIYIDKNQEPKVENITEKIIEERRIIKKDPLYGEDTSWEYYCDKTSIEKVKLYVPEGSIIQKYNTNYD